MLSESQILLNVSRLYIENYLKDEFIKQGHELSGEWENGILSQEEGEDSVGIYATGYGMIVDAGVTADRIPYGGVGTGGEGISKYILGLARFWKLRKPGITDKAALKLAFATAEVQKKEGMSTAASEVYSATGDRQHFMEALERLFEDYADEAIFTGLDNVLQEQTKEPQKMYL